MHSTTLLLALTAQTLLARAQSYGNGYGDYLAQVCQPTNSSGYPDMNAPCNEAIAVELQCLYGPAAGLSAFWSAFGPDAGNASSVDGAKHKRQDDGLIGDGDGDDSPLPQNNATQRICACESQLFDLISGCLVCEKKHGGDSAGAADGLLEAQLGPSFVSSLSSSYCAASATPTLGLPDALNQYYESYASSASASTTAPSSGAHATSSGASFSDPIGNKTDVSLYYTQSVTGSAAWVVAEATDSATTSSGASELPNTYTAANTVSGQIRPTTAGAAAATSGKSSGKTASGSGSATGTSSGGVAKRTEAAAAAVAGVLGFAGLVVLL